MVILRIIGFILIAIGIVFCLTLIGLPIGVLMIILGLLFVLVGKKPARLNVQVVQPQQPPISGDPQTADIRPARNEYLSINIDERLRPILTGLGLTGQVISLIWWSTNTLPPKCIVNIGAECQLAKTAESVIGHPWIYQPWLLYVSFALIIIANNFRRTSR
jgi:xanthosine utilization system XapX-like protein